MLKLEDLAWHRMMGRLINGLNQPDFWPRLVLTVGELVPFDNWVAMVYCPHGSPIVLADMPAEDEEAERLFHEYLDGVYLLDPFYRASLEWQQPTVSRLDDVAPDCFHLTDYYQRYFKLNVVADEVQFSLPVPEIGVVSLSVGTKRRFTLAEYEIFSLIQPWVSALIQQRLGYDLDIDNAPVRSAERFTGKDLSASCLHWNGTVLTARESDVGRLMLSGYSTKAIAQKLKIAVETVRVHKKHIYTKLEINSQSELFSIFLQG